MATKFESSILNAIEILLFMALLLLTGFYIGRRYDRDVWAEPEVRHDTVRVTDTVVIEKPEPTRIVETDSILVPLVNVVTVHDTVYAQLPIEQKEYRDSSYRAVISGFRPNLDLIEVYPVVTTVTVSKTLTKSQGGFWSSKRFGFGVAVGPSILVTPAGNVRAGVGVTGGVYLRL